HPSGHAANGRRPGWRPGCHWATGSILRYTRERCVYRAAASSTLKMPQDLFGERVIKIVRHRKLSCGETKGTQLWNILVDGPNFGQGLVGSGDDESFSGFYLPKVTQQITLDLLDRDDGHRALPFRSR